MLTGTLTRRAANAHSRPLAIMANGTDGRPGTENEVGIATKAKARPKKPSQYKVLMLNDDYTPMEFVVMVLQEFFSKDLETATQIMLKVHVEGRGVCGVYSKDVATTKVEQVLEAAHKAGHPLKCVSEPAP